MPHYREISEPLHEILCRWVPRCRDMTTWPRADHPMVLHLARAVATIERLSHVEPDIPFLMEQPVETYLDMMFLGTLLIALGALLTPEARRLSVREINIVLWWVAEGTVAARPGAVNLVSGCDEPFE